MIKVTWNEQVSYRQEEVLNAYSRGTQTNRDCYDVNLGQPGYRRSKR